MKISIAHVHSIVPVLLLLLLCGTVWGCGDEHDGNSAAIDTSGIPVIDQTPSGPRDSGYDPANETNFEEMLVREYAQLSTRASSKSIDSVISQAMAREKNPQKIKKAISSAMESAFRRQDSIARATLSSKYAISLDSVDAIIRERGDRTKIPSGN